MGARIEGGVGGGGRQLYNLHAPKTWLKARVLMSGYYGHLNSFHAANRSDFKPGILMPGNCLIVVQPSLSQRPGFKPGF